MRTPFIRALTGVITFIVGIGLHIHYSTVNKQCTSPLGQLGQAFAKGETMSGMPDCSTAHLAIQASWLLMIAGGILFVIALSDLLQRNKRRVQS